ncbi:DUF2798 domain-containing protein [Saccharospirillum sp. MSK14-1]|uniref:DUF2798 domain-containing protein n=1 Tax=Saccharospirillum sp. MSK14-1 TaxID=1897632 RepID=UPI001E3898C9|nr:DUF2798 domain-containing protein [Saccharospirillum sp. MSK14-1]
MLLALFNAPATHYITAAEKIETGSVIPVPAPAGCSRFQRTHGTTDVKPGWCCDDNCLSCHAPSLFYEDAMTNTRILITAQLFISCMMALLMSGIMSAISLGFSMLWLYVWLQNFLIAWPIAFVLSMLVSKLAFWLAFKLFARFEKTV